MSRVSFGDDRNVELESGDICTTLNVLKTIEPWVKLRFLTAWWPVSNGRHPGEHNPEKSCMAILCMAPETIQRHFHAF